MGSKATHHNEARTPVQPEMKKRVTMTTDYWLQKHSGRCTFKRTKALERSILNGGAVGRQQCENQPTRKKVWAMSKPEEVSAPAQC
jgi:hypothetical protein